RAATARRDAPEAPRREALDARDAGGVVPRLRGRAGTGSVVICIRCNKSCTYRERANRICPGCYGRFAFEPREGDPFSDAAFKGALQRVSGNGGVRFGLDHLYYELCRQQRAKRPGKLGVGLVIAGLMVAAELITLPIHVSTGLRAT